MARLPPPVTMITCSIPLAMASSTPYWMVGLSTSGSISLGCALVTGRNLVPSPAAGKIALRTGGRVIGDNLSGGDLLFRGRLASLVRQVLRELLQSGVDRDDLRAPDLLVARLHARALARRDAIQLIAHVLMVASRC